jgi:hypothetical protein
MINSWVLTMILYISKMDNVILIVGEAKNHEYEM